jgi:DNA polymerase
VTSPDGRLRNGWQFFGASRTGRVAGRTLNPANLARPAIKHPELAVEIIATGSLDLLEVMYPEKSALDTLSSCIRASLKAPAGKLWCVADLSSIESVGLAWLAGCRTILDIFHAGRDTYKSFASMIYGIPYDSVTKAQRTFSKPGWLGFGYRLSGRGLVAYAASMGVEMSAEEGDRQIGIARSTFHEIPNLWDNTYEAAINAVENPGQEFHVYAVNRVTDEVSHERGVWRAYDYQRDRPRMSYWYDGAFLRCRLPSGRVLSYFEPQVAPHTVHLEDYSFTVEKSLSYMGIDQKATSGAWRRLNVHSGLLVENVCQSLCRDVLWNGLEQAEEDPGLEVVGDAYDELLTLCDERDTEALNRLKRYMTSLPPWLDDTFYLGASGYMLARYTKD